MALNEKHLLSGHPVRNLLNRLVGRPGIEPGTRGLKDRKTIVDQLVDPSWFKFFLKFLIFGVFIAVMVQYVRFLERIGNWLLGLF